MENVGCSLMTLSQPANEANIYMYNNEQTARILFPTLIIVSNVIPMNIYGDFRTVSSLPSVYRSSDHDMIIYYPINHHLIYCTSKSLFSSDCSYASKSLSL